MLGPLIPIRNNLDAARGDRPSNTRNFLCWVARVLVQFFTISRYPTWGAIACRMVARVTRMLAFLLPLKVILLAGSEDVPRYFRFLISPESKDVGIVILSAGAVAAYALTVFLESHSRQLAEQGGVDLLAASGVMSVVPGQREHMQNFYARFTGVAAAMLFAFASIAVLLALNPALTTFLLSMLVVLYLLTTWALRDVSALNRTRLSDFIMGNFGSYLGILSSVAFLSSFLVILYPFIVGANGSILVAIVSFVLIRQLLSAVSDGAKDMVALAGQRPLIDALVFPEHQFKPAEATDHRTLCEVFGRHERERLVATELASLAQPGQVFRTEWQDPVYRGTGDFTLTLEGGNALARHFRTRAFPPRLRYMVENEDLLFSHVDRAAIWAPPLAKRFLHGDYECLVWETGEGNSPTWRQWSEVEDGFLALLWSYEPSPALLKIYASSHSFLHQRLTDALVARMDIGADTDTEAAALERLRTLLPSIRDLLAAMPLRLVNPDARRTTTVVSSSGQPVVLTWGRWAIEPLGAGNPHLALTDDRCAGLLTLARTNYPAAIPDWIRADQLMLVTQCSKLEREIINGAFKSAVKTTATILTLHQFSEGAS